VFVEEAIEPRGLIRRNIEQLEFTGVTKLFRRDATNLGPMKRFQFFNLVFIDPPYNKGLGEKAISSAIDGQWLANEALIILEESKSATITWPNGIELLDEKNYGDTTLYYAKWQAKEG
jgi:16S rRNA (guanine966-N2)-methyltransferase